MFRPMMAAALALGLVVLSACADAPQRRVGTAAPPPAAGSPAAVVEPLARPVPPPAVPSAGAVRAEPAPDLNIGVDPAGIESCRERCERNFRICGDSVIATREDYVGSLGTPRLFSQRDDCQYQLRQCFRRCSAP